MSHTRLALILVVFPLLIFLSACQENTALNSALEDLSQADLRLNKLRTNNQQTIAEKHEKFLAAQEIVHTLTIQADENDTKLHDARLELSALHENFATYRHAYRTKLREKILKFVFPKVNLSNGRILKNVRVQSILNGEIRYMSDASTGKIAFADVPPPIATFLRLSEEKFDRATFPEIATPRETDFNAEVELTKKLNNIKNILGSEKIDSNSQEIRTLKGELYKNYENRERELRSMITTLDTSRKALTQKRQRHHEYNEFHRTNARNSAIKNLSRSIAKIDDRSKTIYEKINAIRKLMSEAR